MEYLKDLKHLSNSDFQLHCMVSPNLESEQVIWHIWLAQTLLGEG